MDIVFAGVPIIIVVFGLVEFAKQLGVEGKNSLILSLVLGVIFGAGYWLAENGAPGVYSDWFGMVVFSLAMGLTPSGLYNWSDTRFPPQ